MQYICYLICLGSSDLCPFVTEYLLKESWEELAE